MAYVLELNEVRIEAYTSHHIDSAKALENRKPYALYAGPKCLLAPLTN
jgi:hypothetical protein